jgi:predicted phage baseplate assembly protein
VTFWLSAPQPAAVVIPVETEVASVKTETDDAVGFVTVEPLSIVPCALSRVLSMIEEGSPRDHTRGHRDRRPFYCFDAVPKPDDALLIGLSDAVPSCAVALRFDCRVEGIGVDPTWPPLAWEAWNGVAWAACDVERDDTGGLNRPGDVLVHVPADHIATVLHRHRAGWLRCRVVPAEVDQPAYSGSPQITSIDAFTVGGTVAAVHATRVTDEIVGLSEGVAGQRFSLRHRPVVTGRGQFGVHVAGGDAWEEWHDVDSFARSSAADRHVHLDATAGEVAFGPAVREPDGGVRNRGAVPPTGAALVVREYWTGGGRAGNVAAHTLTVLKASVPYVTSVDNRSPARGGVDGESIEEAKARGPLALRTADRAVTAGDFELLTRVIAPELGRVYCASVAGADALVRVLVVPSAAIGEADVLQFDQLSPDAEVLARIAAFLDERRVVGTRVLVEPPFYKAVTVVGTVHTLPGAVTSTVEATATAAINRYLSPLDGGPDGTGWPFGRPLHAGEIFGVLQRVPAVALVDEVQLFPADPVTGERGEPGERITPAADELVFSYAPQIRAVEP